jgi:hypothetical protein
VLEVRSRAGEKSGLCRMQYLVVNGRAQPYQADQAVTLKMQVRAVSAVEEVLVNDHALVTIPADRAQAATLSFPLPADGLSKLTKITIRAVENGQQRSNFNVGPIWLEYHGKSLYDLRFPTFGRQWLGDALPGHQRECNWYFAMP